MLFCVILLNYFIYFLSSNTATVAYNGMVGVYLNIINLTCKQNFIQVS